MSRTYSTDINKPQHGVGVCLVALLVNHLFQVHATESQLEFAHKQLDIRQQELRSQADAATAAKRSGEQLVTELETLKDELLASRREVEAGRTPLM